MSSTAIPCARRELHSGRVGGRRPTANGSPFGPGGRSRRQIHRSPGARCATEGWGFESRTSMPRRQLYRALDRLVKDRRLDVFLLKGQIATGPLSVPPGASGVLPIVFKGPLPPELRASDADIERLLRELRSSR